MAQIPHSRRKAGAGRGRFPLDVFALAAVVTVAALLCMPGAAGAETTFGGDPTQAITPGLDCALGAPPYFHGAESCLWNWSSSSGGDGVPFPETTGGSGTVTSVTLPAMPDPGPMQAVVLTGTLIGSSIPSEPTYDCCQVTELSPIFTVPADQITTVPLNLAVSSQPTPNLAIPGASGSFDGMAISVLSPTASLPLLQTEHTLIGDGAYINRAYFPAPSAPDPEYTEPTDPTGYEMLARFTLGSAPTSAPTTSTPTPTSGPAPKGGLKLGGATLRPGADGKTLTLGKATDPPTATTTQTLTGPGATASRVGHKPLVLGAGKTSVPSGKTAPLRLTLNGKGRAALAKKHSLKATLTIVAANSEGESQTVTRTVTVKPARSHHGR